MFHLSSNGNGREFDLNSLPIGGRFRTTNPYAAPTYGTLIEIGTGSCIVRLDRAAKHVSIRTGNGESVDFDSSRARTTRWQPLTPVEYLNEIEQDVLSGPALPQPHLNSLQGDDINMATAARARVTKSKSTTAASTAATTRKAKPAKAAVVPINKPTPTPTPTPTQPGLPMAAALTPKTRALIARWKLAVTKLGSLLKIDGPVDATTAQRDLVRSLYDEAVVAQVMLPSDPITYKDPVFKEMELAATSGFGTPADDATASDTPVAAAAPPAKTGRKDDAIGKSTKPAKTAQTAQTAQTAATPKSKKVKTTENDCLDGCGEKVTGRFKQGHDAKYRGMILAVERGEAKESSLPSLMRRQGGKNGEPLTFRKLAGDNGYKCMNSAVAH